ncbi:MAG TPA: hypothetical protein V6D14_09045 [Coleofasciculaceae cyanobacterium]
MTTFQELDAYLSQDFSDDYWADDASLYARELVKQLTTEDWNALKSSWQNRSKEWQVRCAEILDWGEAIQAVPLLRQMIQVRDDELTLTAADSLRSLVGVVNPNLPVSKDVLKHLQAVAQTGTIANSKDVLEHLQAVAQTGNIARRIINDLTGNIENFNQLIEKLLTGLREKKRIRDAYQAILEAVLRATNSPPFSQERPPKELVNLGVLIRGMDWGDLSESDWDIMSERYDPEAVETVFKGIIAVLEIDPQILATEAAWILEDIKRIPSYDLDAIEAALRDGENNSPGFAWALDQIEKFLKEYKGPSLLGKIPQVRFKPRWERVKESELSPEVLERALEHPSEGIVQNAALLLEALRA